MKDIIIVGGGPAGMTAALYALRNGKTVTVLEKHGPGGQITYSPKVENWPGTMQMSGNEFADALMDQILQQDGEIELEEAIGATFENGVWTVNTAEGNRFEGKAVILATGVKHRMLGLPGENELVGEGISFCAVCDGDFFTGKKVCVAGGGNSALQEAILLSGKCAEVTVLQDLPVFTGEKKLQDILFGRDNVKAMTGVKITELRKNGTSLAGVTVENAQGEKTEVDCDGLFVAIGLIPENGAFADLAELNSYGYFASGEDCVTKTPGVFVAGDCRSKAIRQLTTAAADGAVAALAACRFVDALE